MSRVAKNRGSEVGAEATQIYEKTCMKAEREAAPGLEDRREPLSAAATCDLPWYLFISYLFTQSPTL